MHMDTYERLREGMKWMWSLGDYREVAPWLEPHAEALAAACDIRPGMEVLDVAAGNGNFAIAAARRGAAVTASDLTPRMVELGRARSEAEGLAIEWLEADAEEILLPADRFDVVASVFGAMFAPRPERVAAELFRLARPGGLMAMANYASRGFLSRFTDLMSRYAPAAQIELPSPFRWGDADEVARRFDGLASSIEMERRIVTFEFDSSGQWLEFWERTNGPQMALKSMLPEEAYREMREQALCLVREMDRSDNGRLALDSEYALVLARKKERQGRSDG
jgi:ubiquinone/menaquinone biosynthesis C-methylase UbiE